MQVNFADSLLTNGASVSAPARILIIRLDRIGDVVLSTPVIRELRDHFPHAHIAMMVRSGCSELVEGNPWLNEVIVYDKEGKHKTPAATLAFARSLARHAFDTAIVLHPSNRSHWIPWLAGIKVRIGYGRKNAWLLTHRISHVKQEGTQHEAAYTLQMLEVFGIHPGPPRPYVPVLEPAAERVAQWLMEAGVGTDEPLIAIHPSASCVSKRWIPERFAQVADRLITEKGVRICLVGGAEDSDLVQAVSAHMRGSALNFAGRLRLRELAALLQRCRLLISNDSGPVHVAAAVGTRVVDIFGRNQKGLSPSRWGPLGEGHTVLHKEVGCVKCLAHRCDIAFKCLTTLDVQTVYSAAVEVLSL